MGYVRDGQRPPTRTGPGESAAAAAPPGSDVPEVTVRHGRLPDPGGLPRGGDALRGPRGEKIGVDDRPHAVNTYGFSSWRWPPPPTLGPCWDGAPHDRGWPCPRALRCARRKRRRRTPPFPSKPGVPRNRLSGMRVPIRSSSPGIASIAVTHGASHHGPSGSVPLPLLRSVWAPSSLRPDGSSAR